MWDKAYISIFLVCWYFRYPPWWHYTLGHFSVWSFLYKSLRWTFWRSLNIYFRKFMAFCFNVRQSIFFSIFETGRREGDNSSSNANWVEISKKKKIGTNLNVPHVTSFWAHRGGGGVVGFLCHRVLCLELLMRFYVLYSGSKFLDLSINIRLQSTLLGHRRHLDKES